MKRLLWKHTHLAGLRIRQVLNPCPLHSRGVWQHWVSACFVFSGIRAVFHAYNMWLSLALLFRFWDLLPEENQSKCALMGAGIRMSSGPLLKETAFFWGVGGVPLKITLSFDISRHFQASAEAPAGTQEEQQRSRAKTMPRAASLAPGETCLNMTRTVKISCGNS